MSKIQLHTIIAGSRLVCWVPHVSSTAQKQALLGDILIVSGCCNWLSYYAHLARRQGDSEPQAEMSGVRFRAAVSDSALVKSEKNAIIRPWQ